MINLLLPLLLAFADEPKVKPEPSVIQLDADEQRTRRELDTQAAHLNTLYRSLRDQACWKRSISPERCGDWVDGLHIQVKPEEKPKANPPEVKAPVLGGSGKPLPKD